MNDLFAPQTAGPLTNVKSGSPEYQDTVVNRATRSLKPAYMQALGGLRNDMQGRGLWNSGIAALGEMDLQQDYLGKLSGITEDAAIRGADVAEENRRRSEERTWRVQDRDTQLAWLREQADRAESAANNSNWANLISGVAGAGGTALGYLWGGPAGAAVGGAAGSALKKPNYNLGGAGNMDFQMDPTLAAYLAGG